MDFGAAPLAVVQVRICTFEVAMQPALNGAVAGVLVHSVFEGRCAGLGLLILVLEVRWVGNTRRLPQGGRIETRLI